MIEYKKTILSQYANSPTLLSLIESFNDCIDPRENVDAFYKNIWDLQTAKGIGLDIWGKIVNVPRKLKLNDLPTAFGFFESKSTPTARFPKPWNQSPFYNGTWLTGYYLLDDDAYRRLIYVKAFANISQNTIPNFNQLLQNLFLGRGRCWVEDGLDMTITYHFEFELSPLDWSILSNLDVIPRPAGVGIIIKIDLPEGAE